MPDVLSGNREFPTGWICAVIAILLVKLLMGKTRRNRDTLYGLDHAVLSLEVPGSMWMNMGYWEV